MIDLFKKYVTASNIVFFVLMILFLVFITKIKDVAILFFASYVISCSLNPIVDKLCDKTKLKRSASSAIVLISGIAACFLFVLPIVVMGGHQIKSFLNLIPSHIQSFKSYLMSLSFLNLSQLNNADIGGLVSSTSDITSNILTKSINVSVGIASTFVYILAACIIIYYFLADKETISKTYISLFPNNMKSRASEIMTSISQKIGGYVIAQIVTMASVGLIVYIGFLILRIDYALILGLLAAVLDIVPIVGPAIALVIILIAVYKLSVFKIGLVIAIFAFAQWAENNLVRPYIFSKFLDLHPLIIYFFLFVTAQYLGVIGVIFAPAIAACVTVLIEELYIKSVN